LSKTPNPRVVTIEYWTVQLAGDFVVVVVVVVAVGATRPLFLD
jgi:hypothetical protein